MAEAPHFAVTVDPGTCKTVISFGLELRSGGVSYRSAFYVPVMAGVGIDVAMSVLSSLAGGGNGNISDMCEGGQRCLLLEQIPREPSGFQPIAETYNDVVYRE